LGIHQSKLRFFSAEGQLIPTPEEVAEQEQQQRSQVEQQLTQAEQQRSQAEQQLTEMESLLTRYRERFGDLPE
jgi:septal ring factor EnvC (AmiA/AmiB activator)